MYIHVQRMREQQAEKERKEDSKKLIIPAASTADTSSSSSSSLFSAYQSKEYTDQEIEDALFDYGLWIYVKKHESQEELIEATVEKIEDGEVVAWFQGKSGRCFLVRIT